MSYRSIVSARRRSLRPMCVTSCAPPKFCTACSSHGASPVLKQVDEKGGVSSVPHPFPCAAARSEAEGLPRQEGATMSGIRAGGGGGFQGGGGGGGAPPPAFFLPPP